MSETISARYGVLVFISLFNLAMLSTSTIMGYKMISIMGMNLSAGTITFPLSYICCDMITEIYGYRVSRLVIWTTFCCLFIFSLLITGLVAAPPAATWHQQALYADVLHGTLRLSLAIIFSLILGDFINAYVLSKWKILLNGRSFWLRSLGSTAVGEITDTLIGFSIFLAGVVSPLKFLTLVMTTVFIKFIYNSVFILPSSLMVAFLKKRLDLDVFDYHTNFNPFKLAFQNSRNDSCPQVKPIS